MPVLDGGSPDPRTGSLIALTYVGGFLPDLFPNRDRKALKARGKEILELDWPGDSVATALQELNSAMAAAIGAAAVAGPGG